MQDELADEVGVGEQLLHQSRPRPSSLTMLRQQLQMPRKLQQGRHSPRLRLRSRALVELYEGIAATPAVRPGLG